MHLLRIFSIPFVVFIFSGMNPTNSFCQEPVNTDLAIQQAKSLSLAFRQAAKSNVASVVTIISKLSPEQFTTAEQLKELMEDPRFRQLFPDGELPLEPDEDGELDLPEIPGLNTHIGSGFIIDSSGTVLTNSHVVQDAKEVIVRLPNGAELVAHDVRSDPNSDLAIVRVSDENELPAASLGDSDSLNIGDWVIAIGSPFELESTVSAGIISGKGRGIDKIRRGQLLQTDAAINPGNSGGPLVNLDGQVVGINTAIATNNGGYQGIGFVIPINRAKWVAKELLEHGKVRRAYLGIAIDELNAETASKLGLTARSGALVLDVMPNSPSATAGIERNDVIVNFAGQDIRGPRDLQDNVEQKEIGSTQKIVVRRNGEDHAYDVRMELFPTAR